MKILMICGVYAEENEQEVLSNTKGYAEQSANIFQRKLIEGIDNNQIAYEVISAPLIGAYPMRFTKCRFCGFAENNGKYRYVPFINIWGIRSISRTLSLKKAVKEYLKQEQEEDILILVYCPHTPFLEAAIYAKELKPKSKVCLIVPDLPQYMNLNEKGRGLYDFCKKFDIRYMERFIAKVDSFVILTEPMKEILEIGSRPYMVAEGVISSESHVSHNVSLNDGITRIVYTGKMNMKFGIKELVDSFMMLEDPSLRLILCGDGDAKVYVEERAALDQRIEYKGMLTSAKAKEYIDMADVLVNPRPNNEEYTKYSFPSKNIEYLMTGKPVVGYMLDGMPPIYKEFMFVIPKEKKIFDAVLHAAIMQKNAKTDFKEYAEKLRASKLIQQIVTMNDCKQHD